MATCANGHANQEGLLYCTVCGSPLAAAPAAMPPPVPPTPPGMPPLPPTAGPPMQPYVPADPTAAGDGSTKKGKSKVIIGVVAVVAVVAAAAGAVTLLGGDDGGGDSNLVVLGEPNDEAADLYLVPMGTDLAEAEPFVDDAILAPFSAFQDPTSGNSVIAPAILPISGGAVVAWYADEELTIGAVDRATGEVTELYDDEATGTPIFDSARNRVLLQTYDDQSSCYAGELGQELERLARADGCMFDPSGLLVSYDGNDDGSYDVTVHDDAGEELPGIELDTYPAVSTTGNWIYGSGQGDGIEVFDARTGEEAASVGDDQSLVLASAAAADVLLYGTDEGDDEVSVGAITADGETHDLASGEAMSGELSNDGTQAILLDTTSDGATLSRVDVASGDATELLDEDDLQFEILQGDSPQILAWRDDGSSVWIGDVASGELRDVGDLGDAGFVNQISWDGSHSTLYISASGDDETALYRLLSGADTELEDLGGDWSSFSVGEVGTDGTILGSATDGDDTVLVTVSGDQVEEIDSNGTIVSAHLGDSSVTYTSADAYDQLDDAEVLSAPTNGEGPPETLYENTVLFGRAEGAVGTQDHFSLSELDLGRPVIGGFTEIGDTIDDVGNTIDDVGEYVDIAGCSETLSDGDSYSGYLDGAPETLCVDVTTSGYLTVSVDADIDTKLTLYDDSDSEVAYSDDDDPDGGYDPYFDGIFVSEGTHSLVIENYYSDDTGGYTLELFLD
jgi:hypothetical protein